jgi:hypothetical protein
MSLFVGVAALTALLFPAMSAAQQCIPSCDEKDGRTLAITNGAGLSTLTDLTLDISVRANAQEAFFLLGFFDGQTGGLWDLKNPAAAPQQNFSLFADPLGDGTCGGDGCDGADMITLFDGEAMPDNAWFDENVANDIRALNGDGSLYIYLLRAELGGTLTPPVRNSFKVRTGVPEQASIEVFQQPFAFNAAMPTFKELEIIYPGCAGLGLADTPPDFSMLGTCLAAIGETENETTYDGTFSFFVEQIQPQCEFIVWDGDLDYGRFDQADLDVDDGNTPAGLAGLPPWACFDPTQPCDATFDGVAWVGANPPLPVVNFEDKALGLCTGGARNGRPCICSSIDPSCNPYPFPNPPTQPFVATCPGGTCGVTGDPPDNFNSGALGGLGAIFVRGGSLTYEVYDPNGVKLATNTNPSGNQEWELFRLAVPDGGCYLDENGNPPDVDVDALPAGVYEVRLQGLDLENLNAFRFDGRSVPSPCDECKGGVVQLTLEYNGSLDPDPIIRVEKDSNEVYFEGAVMPNGRFTFQGTGSDNKMASNIKVFVNGILNTEIHTSCSQPIFPGLVSGDFTVVEGISKDKGLICVDIGCNECDGGVTDLTFRYEGVFPVELAIYDDDKVNLDKVLLQPTIVNPGDEVSITKRDGQDKFSSNISLWIDGVKFELHTSCSQPIGPGQTVGDFVIVSGTSRNAGDMCPVDVPTDPGCDECDGGATQLAFRNVTGAPVAVEIYDDKDPKADKLLFAGTLMAGGETGTLSGTRSDGKFNSDVSIWVDGVRVAKVHTSCSQPIGIGLVFGGFEVVSGASKNNGSFCPADCAPAQLNFEVKDDEVKFKIANNGTTPLQIQKVIVEWPEDKGDLKKIEFDGTIFEQNVPWQTGPVEITDFSGEPKQRALKAGDDHDLKLRFADKTTTGLHFVRVEFNSGCFIEADSSTPPGGGGTFTCSKDIDALTMIWQPEAGSPAAGQDVYVKAWKDTPGETLLFADDVAIGGEFTVSGYAPKDGNDVVWEIFANSSSTTPLGTSVFHLSCSDSEMNGAEDCGKRQGDGKGNDSSRLNDWLFEGMVDSDETLDCTP